MRQLLTLTLLVLCLLSFGQTQIGHKENTPDYYVFNNANDTIYLTNVYLGKFTYTDSMNIVDSVQIDGIGSKEIIFVRYVQGNTNAHGGMFDIEDHRVIAKYEIWNVDTKTLIFEAISNYKNVFNNAYAYVFNCGSDSCRQGQGSANYKYDILFNENGQASISNLENDVDCIPDHSEGLYKFIKDKYIPE